MTDKHKNGSCNECLFNVQIEHEALELAAQILGDSETECTDECNSKECLSEDYSCKDCWRNYLMKTAAERIKGKRYES